MTVKFYLVVILTIGEVHEIAEFNTHAECRYHADLWRAAPLALCEPRTVSDD